MVARSIAFAFIVGLFPFIAAVVALYGLFADPVTAPEHLRLLAGVLPRGILAWLGEEVLRIASTNEAGLSLALVVGLSVALWSANIAVRALIRGLNIAKRRREDRGPVRLALTSLGLAAGGFGFVLLTAATALTIPLFGRWLGLQPDIAVLAALRWPVLWAAALLIMALLYHFGPAGRQGRCRWFTPGTVLAASVWLFGSVAFSWFMTHVADLERTYGSFAALFAFLTWTWLSSLIVLVGARLDADLQALSPAGRAEDTGG